MKRSWGVSTGMDPHICATCTSYEYMSPADACPVWLKAVTFTVLERLVKSKRSASDLAPYHISAQLILLTYYSRYTGGTAVDNQFPKFPKPNMLDLGFIFMSYLRDLDGLGSKSEAKNLSHEFASALPEG